MKGKATALAFGIAVLLCGRLAAGEEKEAYRIVVQAANHESAIEKEQLSAFFLKNARKWKDGIAVFPVDQSVISPTRVAFSRHVFGQPVMAIETYWQGRLSRARVAPPPVKASDGEVMAYVETTPGAIGYVSPGATLSPRLKFLKMTE